ncbi:isoleucine--tRNA ligase [Candidatus Portiera aleyrodidarum]|uniref:isoleucine--tRNA ligase n=1 Tax=Candidatus Portiera aleyrodidarum TaxID=91844 RepID=UPI00027B3080|nr:isoleucine--tRNA ligase [Candidatus Portiera aleyrodidarum]AFQ24075.1 Isoleucyl-tRNA synthetase [Candidatus Portiera aleyrodidarum BT-B-HRs]ASX27125.1 isoleucine--tRNA ligase [Candidatus Portiera aleyrodidarum MED (Bemisia tabaci)]
MINVRYNNTLNLPKTTFPMRGNLSIKEPIRLNKWKQSEIYKKLRQDRKGCKKFILHDGPPYANGHIHIGHAVNKILKDIIIKSKNLEGCDSWYVPGWDCHGLPIELNILKNNNGKFLTSNKIMLYCRKYVEKQIYSQKVDFIRLGILGDWDNAYRTMDFINQAGIIRSLSAIVKKGYVFRGLKPVNWCFQCSSALAESEVDFLEKVSESIDVAFFCIDNYKLVKNFGVNNCIEKPIEVVSWTTTPWSIPANQAIHVLAFCIYVLVDVGVKFILLAEQLVENCLNRYQLNGKIIAKTFGKELEKVRLKHPLHNIDAFYDRITNIYIADYIAIKTGTGIIHASPAYGEDDFIVYSNLQYNENMLKLVKSNGFYIKYLSVFGGQLIWIANSEIINNLNNRIIAKELILHSYMYCWRHKNPLIKMATSQWFVGMDVGKISLRKKALDCLKNVKVYPSSGKTRLYHMISNRPDWCISRQRSWGVPIPFFIKKKRCLLHQRIIEIMEIIAKKVQNEGSEVWIKIKSCEVFGDEDIVYKKITDILDVWFDSGTTHNHVLRGSNFILQKEDKADLYLEGLDQYRGWFHTSLITSAAISGHAPFNKLLSHCFTVDKNGQKMSKSIGNVVSPQTIISKYGADILRLWVVSKDYESEMTMSEDIIQLIADSYRRLRNTTRFMIANLSGFDQSKHGIDPEKLLALDRWALDISANFQHAIKNSYKDYRFVDIYQQLCNFCTRDLGSFYLDIIKDRQYTTQKNSLYRRSCQTTLYHIIEAMSRWITPICTFTAEEIYESLSVKRYNKSVLLETYYRELNPLPKGLVMGRVFWKIIKAVKSEVNKCLENYRKKNIIKSSLDAKVTLYVSETYYKILSLLKGELRFVLITSSAFLKKSVNKTKTAIFTGLSGLQVLVQKSKYKKCERSWELLPDVGRYNKHPKLCARSIDNLPRGPGEVRLYV